MEASASPAAREEAEEDFFDSWSKPSTPKNSAPGTPRVSTPPIIGRNVPTSSSTPASAPRTITSSSTSRPGKLGGGASRLNSASSTSSTSTVKKSKLGLGASKAKPVDFAEAERKALEEAERIKQLGYDRQREEQEEKARKEAEALKKATEIVPKATLPTTTNGSSSKPAAPTSHSTAFPRLGFGAIPGAGAAAAIASTTTTSSRFTLITADDSPTTARDKFGSQKAISSDMYFGRNSYDPAAVSEAQTRLQSFRGATSISSNQYFGRDEEEELADRGHGESGILGDGSLAGLELAAKDAIAKVLANPDVQNVGESIRSGALKVCRDLIRAGVSSRRTDSFYSSRTTLRRCLSGDRLQVFC